MDNKFIKLRKQTDTDNLWYRYRQSLQVDIRVQNIKEKHANQLVKPPKGSGDDVDFLNCFPWPYQCQYCGCRDLGVSNEISHFIAGEIVTSLEPSVTPYQKIENSEESEGM